MKAIHVRFFAGFKVDFAVFSSGLDKKKLKIKAGTFSLR
jgi:hypothetical protein